MIGQQTGRDAPSDQARYTNATCKVRSGELLPLVSTSWATRQAAAHAQAFRHRDVDQPAEVRMVTLLSA